MRCSDLSEKEWVALKEAGKSAGKSIHSLRLLIQRGRMEKMRRQRMNGDESPEESGDRYGEIREDTMNVKSPEQAGIMRPSQVSGSLFHETLSAPSQMISLPVEYFEQQQKERESLAQGLMMYRYKFEQAEKQLRLLPAPAESVTSKIRGLEEKVEAERDTSGAGRTDHVPGSRASAGAAPMVEEDMGEVRRYAHSYHGGTASGADDLLGPCRGQPGSAG
jgi:hypothetical protein